jgi:hypothetical protein
MLPELLILKAIVVSREGKMKMVRIDGNKSLYLVFMRVIFLSILNCF